MPESRPLTVRPDVAAEAWLEAHPTQGPRVIAYDVHRCCGGGKICQVRIRERTPGDEPGRFELADAGDGRIWWVDRRAASRLPKSLAVGVRGRGKKAHLDLELDPDQWGELLYT